MNIEDLGLEFVRAHPREAVSALEILDLDELGKFLERIPAQDAAHILKQLMPQTAASCLSNMETMAAAHAVGLLATDVAAMLLRRVETQTRHAILVALPAAAGAMLRAAMRYSDAVVGSIMDADTPVVPKDARVSDVRKLLRRLGERMQHTLFVVDDNKHLVGVADIRQLLGARDSERMEELCRRPFRTLSARASLVDLRDHAAWGPFDSLPVVDQKGMLLGSVAKETLDRALSHGQAPEGGETDLAGLALDFAEIFWSVCADMFSRTGTDPQRRKV